MEHVLIKNIAKHTGEKTTIKGWVHHKRIQGKIAFLEVRDGTGYIQVTVLQKHVKDQVFELVENFNLESSITVTGEAKADDRSPYGFEIFADKIELIHQADLDYPIGKKEHGIGFLMDNRHLWLRTKRQQSILRIRDTIYQTIINFYEDRDFTKIDTPIFTPAACEGTTTLFEVDYFDEKVYLSQSGQLYLEAVLPALNRVFDFQPVFRAEKSKTRRHLTEFWMNNAEMAFFTHQDNMKLQEELIYSVIQNVLKENKEDLEVLERDTSALENIKTPFPRITHKEAVAKLQELGSSIKEDEDLGAADETLLMNQYDQPLFVEQYPYKVKAFYMKRSGADPERALCSDLLAPEGYGEVIGGSEREADYETLKQSIIDHDLPLEEFDWYLDQRKYGSVPHSGFGIGLERLVAWMCGLHHVRETIPFPRMLSRTRP